MKRPLCYGHEEHRIHAQMSNSAHSAQDIKKRTGSDYSVARSSTARGDDQSGSESGPGCEKEHDSSSVIIADTADE